jgi:hypothetical protein
MAGAYTGAFGANGYVVGSFSVTGKDFYKAFLKSIEQKFETRARDILIYLNEKILVSTPVWEGATITNYRWSGGSPQTVDGAPIDTGDPGQTSMMPLGAEPRRPANEAAPRASFAKLLGQKKLPTLIFLTNASEGAVPLELREWPTPDRSRTPHGGIIKLAVAQVEAGLKSQQ